MSSIGAAAWGAGWGGEGLFEGADLAASTAATIEAVVRHELDPYAAADRLLQGVAGGRGVQETDAVAVDGTEQHDESGEFKQGFAFRFFAGAIEHRLGPRSGHPR